MSVKILNAYYVPNLDNASFTQVHEFIDELLDKIRPIVRDRYVLDVVESVIAEADLATIKGRTAAFENTMVNIKSDDFRSFDTSYNGAIYIVTHKKKVYFRYTFPDQIWEEFEHKVKLPILDYHYQNSTDKPDEVSTREWNQRLKVWTAVSKKGDLRLSGFGRHAFLNDQTPRVSWNDRVMFQPDKDYRLDLQARNLQRDEYVFSRAEELAKEKGKAVEDVYRTDIVGLIYESSKHITPDMINAKISELDKILKNYYTEEDLKDIYGWNS